MAVFTLLINIFLVENQQLAEFNCCRVCECVLVGHSTNTNAHTLTCTSIQRTHYAGVGRRSTTTQRTQQLRYASAHQQLSRSRKTKAESPEPKAESRSRKHNVPEVVASPMSECGLLTFGCWRPERVGSAVALSADLQELLRTASSALNGNGTIHTLMFQALAAMQLSSRCCQLFCKTLKRQVCKNFEFY